jgi:hypothetical protein
MRHLPRPCRFDRLVKNGAKRAAGPFGDESETLAYVKDPDGIWIELIGLGGGFEKASD